MNEHMQHQQREKRLKVSRACYTCRIKKIKCDGIQPCMQCKARNKICSFSKNGAMDQSNKTPPKQEDFALEHRQSQQPTNNKDQEDLRHVSSQLDKLSKLSPGEGKEGRWFIDINFILNGAQQPQQQQQQVFLDLNIHLLSLYFRYRHTVFPIFSKSIFYRLLEHRDPFITPLLLNSIYCHAAHFSQGDAIHANAYYQKADHLLQQELCHSPPSLSIITSLCLLATFESNHFTTGPRVSPQKAFMYLDMACRMCYDLKLHKRYAFHHAGTTPDEIELRKRVYWVCYCYDKLHYLMTEKPILLASTMDIDLPTLVLDSDDPSEYEINACFLEHIKLMQLCETISSTTALETSSHFIEEQLLYWHSSLPPSLQWNVTMSQPSCVSHLHLVFYYVQLAAAAATGQRKKRALAASSLTQHVGVMSEQPYCILSFQLAAEALVASVRVHLLDCADEDLHTAQHARSMYQRSLRTLKTLLHHRCISIEGFVHVLNDTLLVTSNHYPNSSTSSSPIHTLSPVMIPKQQQQQQNKYGIASPISTSTELMYDHDIPTTTTTTTNNNNWSKQDKKEKEQEFMLFTPRYGLGVYASAHQHHTDVLRQHMPNIKTNNSNRPVLLNHFGQVVVQQQHQ